MQQVQYVKSSVGVCYYLLYYLFCLPLLRARGVAFDMKASFQCPICGDSPQVVIYVMEQCWAFEKISLKAFAAQVSAVMYDLDMWEQAC